MSDRSEQALRERLELAKKATRGPWTKKIRCFGVEEVYGSDEWHPVVESQKDENICYLYANANAEDDAAHIAASSPDVVRADLEEILALRAEVGRLKSENARLDREADQLAEFLSDYDNSLPSMGSCPANLDGFDFECPFEREKTAFGCFDYAPYCWREAARKVINEEKDDE